MIAFCISVIIYSSWNFKVGIIYNTRNFEDGTIPKLRAYNLFLELETDKEWVFELHLKITQHMHIAFAGVATMYIGMSME
jgi:hypothetical protein